MNEPVIIFFIGVSVGALITSVLYIFFPFLFHLVPFFVWYEKKIMCSRIGKYKIFRIISEWLLRKVKIRNAYISINAFEIWRYLSNNDQTPLKTYFREADAIIDRYLYRFVSSDYVVSRIAETKKQFDVINSQNSQSI